MKNEFCECCHEELTDKRRHVKYCSDQCRKRHWARMKKMFPEKKKVPEPNKNKGPIVGTLEEIMSVPFDTDHSYGWKNKTKRGY